MLGVLKFSIDFAPAHPSDTVCIELLMGPACFAPNPRSVHLCVSCLPFYFDERPRRIYNLKIVNNNTPTGIYTEFHISNKASFDQIPSRWLIMHHSAPQLRRLKKNDLNNDKQSEPVHPGLCRISFIIRINGYLYADAKNKTSRCCWSGWSFTMSPMKSAESQSKFIDPILPGKDKQMALWRRVFRWTD